MAYSVLVRDEPIGGEARDVFTLDFLTEEITVAELIQERVHQEVRDFNARAAGEPLFRGLIQPTDSERTLNGFRLKKQRMIEWKPQAEIALQSFLENGFLVIINDRQAEALEERVRISTGTSVSFVKMTPLVGG